MAFKLGLARLWNKRKILMDLMVSMHRHLRGRRITCGSEQNRVPVLLAAVIGRAMIMGRERSELRALQASRKRKR